MAYIKFLLLAQLFRLEDRAGELPEAEVSHAVHLGGFLVSLGAYWKKPRLDMVSLLAATRS